MHKHKVVILCLLTVLLLIRTTAVGDVRLTNTEHGMTGTTTVRLVIPSSYVVEIPATVSIPYGATSTPLTIGVSSIELGSRQVVEITADSSSGTLVQESGNDTIPFTLSCNGEAFSSVCYSYPKQTQLSIDIALEDWYSADAGEYSGIVTFRVSVGRQEVAQ